MNNNNTNNYKVFLGRLPPGINDDTLREIMANAGIIPSKLLFKKYFALIDLPDGLSAEEAIPKLKGMYTRFRFPLSIS